MSGIPSFAIVVKPTEVSVPPSVCWDVESLIDQKVESGDAWQTSFENAWQLPLLERILAAGSRTSLRYLTQEVALIPGETLATTLEEFDELLAWLTDNPEAIAQHNLGRSFSHAEVVSALAAAQPDHLVDEDNYKTMLEAFCAFLASQRAALYYASTSGQYVVYVQFQG